MDNKLWVITQFTHVTPGNLRAFVNVKIKDVITGQVVERRLRSGEEVERIDLDRREIEFLYSDPSGHHFMDTENYDQFSLSDDIFGECGKYLKPNTKCQGLFHEEKPITLELPQTVDLLITETPPVATGATATNQLKEAFCETGLRIRVPQFIKQGETVRVSTETGEYLSRA
jgi:elongation factor P